MTWRWALILSGRLIPFRIRAAVLLLVVAALGAFLTNSIYLTYLNGRQAQLVGLISERGDVTSSVVQAPSSARATLSGLNGSMAVTSRDARLAFEGAESPVTAWTVAEAGRAFQYIVAGRRPGAVGEMAVSRQVQRALGISIGDEVALISENAAAPHMVVGVTVNPSNPRASSILEFDPVASEADPDYWVLSPQAVTELRQDVFLKDLFNNGELSATSNLTVLREGAQELPSRIVLLRTATWLTGATYLVVSMLVLSSLAQLARRDVAALSAAGMPEDAAWRLICFTAGFIGTLAASVGTLLSLAIVEAISPSLAHLVGTDWLAVNWAWRPIVLVLWVSAILPILLRYLTRWVDALQRTQRLRSSAREARLRRRGATAGAVGLVLAAVALLPHWGTGLSVFPLSAGLAGIGTGLYLGIGVLASSRQPAAARQITREVLARRSGFVGCAALVACLGAGHAAITTHDATAVAAISQKPLQPKGSLLALQVPESAVLDLTRSYRARGGKRLVVYGLPLSTRGDVRALAFSGSKFGAMVLYVGFDADLGLEEVVGQPEAISDGMVELVLETSSGAQRIGKFKARPDSQLGGNLPGVLVSPNGAIARQLAMRDSDFELVAFLDFDALATREAAAFQSDLRRFAPSAILNSSESVDPLEPDLANARITSSGSALLAGGVILAGSVAVSIYYRRFRTILVELGASRRFRLQILRATTIADLSAGGVIIVGFLAAIERVSHAPSGGSVGVWWGLPIIVVAILGIADSARLVLATPSRAMADRRPHH